MDEVARANGIVDLDYIQAGSQMLIPESRRGVSYSVQPGDTLTGVAARFGVSLSEVISYNPQVDDPDLIYPGQVLLIPVRALGGQAPLAANQPVRELIGQHAAKFGVDPQLVEALAWQESGWQQHVISSAGAIGVMQVMPETARWLASDVIGQPLDVAASASDNVLAGVAYLRWLLDRTGDVGQALAGYYQGLESVRKYGPFQETRRFVDNVLAIYRVLLVTGMPPQ